MNLGFTQIFKLRRRGLASKKASANKGEELPGAYDKDQGDFAGASFHESQGTEIKLDLNHS